MALKLSDDELRRIDELNAAPGEPSPALVKALRRERELKCANHLPVADEAKPK